MNNSIMRSPRSVRLFGAIVALAIAATACSDAYAAPYVPDPTFNSGQWVVDNAAGDYATRRGQKIVQGDNGDVVVAGIVPGVGEAVGHTKLALVRYSHAGVRQTWSNPGVRGTHDNQYVINRCLWDITHCGDDVDVKAMVRHGDKLFVLMETIGFVILNGNWVAVPEVDVQVFGMDGSWQDYRTVDWLYSANDGSRTVFGGGIGLYETGLDVTTTSLVYAGSAIISGHTRPRFATFTVIPNSSDPWPAVTPVMIPSSNAFCGPSSQCQLTGLALGGRASPTEPPRIYLSGSALMGFPARRDVIAMSIKPDGTLRTSFSGTGFYADGGIGLASRGQNVVVEPSPDTDAIYLLVDVTRECRSGTAIEKLLSNGQPVSAFGSFGTLAYGGSDEPNPSTCATASLIGWISKSYPTDLVYAQGQLGVSGLTSYGGCSGGPPCAEDTVDGEIAVIDSQTGALNSWHDYPYSDTPGSPRSRHSAFWGISAANDGTFSVAGDVRYVETEPVDRRGTQMFATLRVAPFSDVIFKNGFDLPNP